MKKIVLVFIICSLSLVSIAQRSWEKGPLTWDDFKSKDYSNSIGYTSELIYFLGFKSDKIKDNDTIINYYKAYNFIDTASSWVNIETKSEQHLLYNQIVFNIVEFYTRSLQKELLSSNQKYESTLIGVLHQCSNEINQFKTETNFGANRKQIDFWDKKINDKLKSITFFKIPTIELSNFSYGMNLGLNGTMLSGKASNCLTIAKGLIYGFEFGNKKISVFINASFGACAVKTAMIDKPYWDKESKTSLTIIDLSIGRSVYDGAKFKIIPYAGISVVELSKKQMSNNPPEHALENYNIDVGLICDYKLIKRYNLINTSRFANRKEYNQASIRAKTFISPVNYSTNLKGLCINFAMEFSFLGRFIKQ